MIDTDKKPAKADKKPEPRELTLHELNQQAARFAMERARSTSETVRLCLDIITEREGADAAAAVADVLPSLLSGKRVQLPRSKPVRAPMA